MAADDSDTSSLSSAASDKEIAKLAPIFTKSKAATKLRCPPPYVSPPRPKRPPSPPHEEVFADTSDIPFIIMFRSRFNDALPNKLANFGPQDLERWVTDQPPSKQAEDLLCSILALVLNRKKPIERGHHGRALEEAVLSQKSQWPRNWQGVNPLHGNRDFNSMSPKERLDLLRTLILWSLNSSEAVQTIIKDKYKQQRHNDDENQPLSVQPWGTDGDKRRYFLVQGLDDTNFRVYREGSRYTKNAHWYNVAGSIDELKALSTKLGDLDGSQAARRLATRITNAIPAFEASEEKRRRREYRQIRQAVFLRPEPGFGMYEGRTRGKRMRYTYDDDEDHDVFDSDATSTRRSTRNVSSRNTPMDTGPTYTASGRPIRQPRRGDYGESLLSHELDNTTDELSPDYKGGTVADGDEEDSEPVRSGGRVMRSSGRRPLVVGGINPRKRKHIEGYNSIDEMSEEEEDAGSGDDEWDSDKNDAADEAMPDAEDEDDNETAESDGDDDGPESLVVRLRVPPKALESPEHNTVNGDTVKNGGVTEPTNLAVSSPYHEISQPVAEAPHVEVATGLPTANGFAHGYSAVQQEANISHPLHHSTSRSAISAYPTPSSTSCPTTDMKPISTVSTPAVSTVYQSHDSVRSNGEGASAVPIIQANAVYSSGFGFRPL